MVALAVAGVDCAVTCRSRAARAAASASSNATARKAMTTIRTMRKRKKVRIPADVLEFAQNLERLERENILIHPDHPAPH